MSILERKVAEMEGLLAGRSSVEVDVGSRSPCPPGTNAGLILEGEAAVILGGPGVPSARHLLYTNESRPGGDRVRLMGSDLAAVGKGRAPFAEVAVLRGSAVTAEVFYQFMQRHKRFLDQPGFMVNSLKEQIWCRVDAKTVSEGFARVSATFLSRVHASFPEIESVDLWWVTMDEERVKAVEKAARDCAETITSIKSGVWKDRGFDYKSCQLAGHCGSCSDKKTCASVRQMEAKVKMKRRLEASAG